VEISVYGSRELRAATLALKAAGRDLRRDIYARMRATMNPEWQDAVNRRTRTRLSQVTIGRKVQIKAGNPPVLMAATSTRRVSKKGGGLIPSVHWAGIEYGTNDPDAYSEYRRRSANGGSHRVRRRVMRHLPARSRGRVLGPAVAEIAPRLASLAVQSIVRAYMDIINPRGG
jgi:hypothetical protein